MGAVVGSRSGKTFNAIVPQQNTRTSAKFETDSTLGTNCQEVVDFIDLVLTSIDIAGDDPGSIVHMLEDKSPAHMSYDKKINRTVNS